MKEKIKNIINSKMIKGSRISDIELIGNSYSIELYNPNLKIGGEFDNDSNDEYYFRDLINQFKDNSPDDIKVVSYCSHEKGAFSIDIILKSEEKLFKKIEKLNLNKNKITKKLNDFIISVSNKMKTRTSTKVTCPTCNSSLNRSYLLKNYSKHLCPVCKNFMYTNTEKEKIKNFQDQLKEIEKELNLF